MTNRSALVIVLAAAVLAPAALADDGPKTSWGDPDLQGTWDFRSITPFQRPAEFKDKEFLTPEEVAKFEETRREGNSRKDLEVRVPLASPDELGAQAILESGVGRADDSRRGPLVTGQADLDVGYNWIFVDVGKQMTGTMRTSLVVDPPDGRLPALTDDAKRRQDERTVRWGQVPAGPEDRDPSDRCIIMSVGPPMNPGAYNNFTEIFQTKDHVAILVEMINDHRIIPLDGRDHVPEDISLWKGDSRGHWDGNTLVVRTKNYTDQTNFRGSGENMILEERFTRTGAGTLLYEYTVNDPESFEKPWSVAYEMKLTEEPLLEFGCHEGNRPMTLALRGARIREAKGEASDDWLSSGQKRRLKERQEKEKARNEQ
jgi:hypothetical protein